jgi:tetratricopeptide (TPR) repeat protein
VKRWDALLETLGFAATALHWFNPLAWLALSRLRIERERDCDNAVLNSGAKPSDYASLLMEIATDVQRRNRPVWQIATISEGSSLKDRLLCILDPKMDRRNGNLGSVFMIGLLVVAFTIPLSGSRLWKTAVVELAGGDDAKQEEVEKKVKEAESCSEEELKKQELKKAQHKKQEKLKIAKPMNVREKLENGMKDDKTRGTSAARVIGLYAYDRGASAATNAYRTFGADSEGGYYFEEKEFNGVGYLLLNVGKVDEAAAIFQMNVEMYPDSWNVYDSLGEAYIRKGDLVRATELYEKSLELNPENENGRKMLQVIEKKK